MTFTYSSELYVVRMHLESEGIECRVLDELTVSANPLYSYAIGGIKLQVKEDDVSRAQEILHAGGYLKQEIPEGPTLFEKLEKSTAGLPLISQFRWEVRVMIVVTVAVLFLIAILYLANEYF